MLLDERGAAVDDAEALGRLGVQQALDEVDGRLAKVLGEGHVAVHDLGIRAHWVLIVERWVTERIETDMRKDGWKTKAINYS